MIINIHELRINGFQFIYIPYLYRCLWVAIVLLIFVASLKSVVRYVPVSDSYYTMINISFVAF